MGVDPGTLATGFGIIEENSKGELTLIHDGVISTKAHKNISAKLKTIFEHLTDVLLKYKPESMAVEDTFYSCNVKSALKLSRVRCSTNAIPWSLSSARTADTVPPGPIGRNGNQFAGMRAVGVDSKNSV